MIVFMAGILPSDALHASASVQRSPQKNFLPSRCLSKKAKLQVHSDEAICDKTHVNTRTHDATAAANIGLAAV